MIVTNAFSFLGGSLMGLAKFGKSYEMMILGRFFIGAFSGKGRATRWGNHGRREGGVYGRWHRGLSRRTGECLSVQLIQKAGWRCLSRSPVAQGATCSRVVITAGEGGWLSCPASGASLKHQLVTV